MKRFIAAVAILISMTFPACAGRLLVTGASNATADYVQGAEHFGEIIKSDMGFEDYTNTAVSGTTMAAILADIDARILDQNADLVILLLPANEMASSIPNNVPVETLVDQIVAPLESVIDAVQASGAEMVVLSPPLARAYREVPRWTPVLQAIKKLCFEKGIHYVPFYERMVYVSDNEPAGFEALLNPEPNIYHLSAAGHALVAQTFLETQHGDTVDAGTQPPPPPPPPPSGGLIPQSEGTTIGDMTPLGAARDEVLNQTAAQSAVSGSGVVSWIGVDYSTSKTISAARIVGSSDKGIAESASQIEVQLWKDACATGAGGGTWTGITSGTVNDEAGFDFSVEIADSASLYCWRLISTGTVDTKFAAEIEFYE